MMKDLNSIDIELAGVNLIEAAAGTGKTYNIQNLAARLIVEKAFPIKSIVIVTFTEKAAAELAERLRIVLEALYRVLQGKPCAAGETARIASLIGHFDLLGITREDQLQRVQNALRDFDENRVSTIHGFCARVLQENAFESSVAFRVPIEPDMDFYIEKLIGDYSRIINYKPRPLPGSEDIVPKAGGGSDSNFYRENFNKKIAALMRKDAIEKNYGCKLYDSETELVAYLDELADKIVAWDTDKLFDGLQDNLKNIKQISGNEWLEAWRCGLELLRNEPDTAPAVTARILANLDYDVLSGSLKSDNTALLDEYHGFLDLTEEYTRFSNEECKLYLTMQGIKFVQQGLAEWKKRDNFQSYDDLIVNVYKALKSPDSPLRDLLRCSFSAGIIDEFQDTDSLQYEIFKEIFINKPDDPIFFMVGDPRQAIYSFRGGDLPAYLKARDACPEERRFALNTNYRSSAPLIGGFNEFFTHNSTFASDQILFNEVKNPASVKPGLLYDGQEIEMPLKVTFLESQLSNSDAGRQERIACVQAIAAMLESGKYFLPESSTPVQPGDIAVLAYNNYELDDIRNHLQKLNIPVVGERKTGIWSSPAAESLDTVLSAVLNSGDESLLRRALLSDWCGCCGANLDMLQQETADFILSQRLAFMNLEKTWRQSGTAAMIREIFTVFEIKKRMAPVPGGERFIANALQLGDLLSSAELGSKLSPRGVLNYLEEKITLSERDDAAVEMLESDRSAVRLMTIHASKGLQFPIVFLPGISERVPGKQNVLKLYHEDGILCCNPDQLIPRATLLAQIEELQESLRLVYVAVTRSCYYCHVICRQIKQNSKDVFTTPIDWLFRMRELEVNDLANTLADFLQLPRLDGSDGDFQLPELKLPCDEVELDKPSEEYIYYPQLPDIDSLIAPKDNDFHLPNWFIASYSSLPLGSHAPQLTIPEAAGDDDSASDRDDCDDETANTLPLPGKLTGGVWSIARGAAIGYAWHQLLEEADFQQGIALEEVVRVMSIYNFKDPMQHKAAYEMFAALLDYQLPCGLKLKDLPNSQRLNELEFLMNSPAGFRISDLCAAGQDYMQQVFSAAVTGSGYFDMQGGFFTGFIDMIFVHNNKFYIVDWKSNALDCDPAMFRGENLKQQLFEKNYQMQYLCYAAALLRYLEQMLGRPMTEELYEHYVGEVYYIFLRGMTLDLPGGLFSTRVPFETARAMAEVITCGKRDQ